MPHQIGTNIGGLASLDAMRERCVCDAEGCWHFRLADGKPMARGKRQSIWLYGGRFSTPARAAWEFHTGKPVPASRVVYRSCESYDCINPQHLRCGTKADEIRMHKKRGTYKERRGDSAKNSASLAKLTAELRLWLLESTQSGVAVAHALGISQGRANAIRAQWRKRAPLAAPSVFSMGLAMNDGHRRKAA